MDGLLTNTRFFPKGLGDLNDFQVVLEGFLKPCPQKSFLLSNTAWSLPCQTSFLVRNHSTKLHILMRSIKDKKEIRRSKRSKFSTKKSSVCDLPSNIFVATLANFQFEIKLFRIYLAVPVPPVDALSSMSLPPGVVGVVGLVVCWWIVGSCGRRVGLLAEINWNSMHQ